MFAYLNEDDCDEKSPVASIDEISIEINKTIKKPLNKSNAESSSNDNAPQAKRNVSKAHKAAAEAALARNRAPSQEISDIISSDSDFFTSLTDMNIECVMNENIEAHNSNTYASDTSVILKPGNYEIILIVDDMEVKGGSTGGKQSRKTLTLEQLETLNIRFETRKLSIGDFIWIARDKNFQRILEDEFSLHQAGNKK